MFWGGINDEGIMPLYLNWLINYAMARGFSGDCLFIKPNTDTASQLENTIGG